jgi:molybdopterin/thiamine biosynthesis adenylyltransferase
MAADRIFVVGAGALGAAVSWGLVLAGFRELTVIDPDSVESSNLPRLPLCPSGAVGALKVTVLAESLAEWGGSVWPVATSLTRENAEALLATATIVFDGSDNWAARTAIQQWALAAKRPWIYMSVLGTDGMTALFDPNEGPCLFCLFSEDLMEGPRCFEVGVLGPSALAVAGLGLSLYESYRGGRWINPGLMLVEGGNPSPQAIHWRDRACPHRAGKGMRDEPRA